MGSSARKFVRQESESTPEPAVLIRAFRKFFRDKQRNPVYTSQSWALFKNGTAVLLGSHKDNVHETTDEMSSTAKRYLKEHGRLVVGTPLADFTVNFDHDLGGWMVRFQNDRIFTFVPGEKMTNNNNNNNNNNYYDDSTTSNNNNNNAYCYGNGYSGGNSLASVVGGGDVSSSSATESPTSAASRSMTFGLLGRMLRQKDARELKIIYVYKSDDENEL